MISEASGFDRENRAAGSLTALEDPKKEKRVSRKSNGIWPMVVPVQGVPSTSAQPYLNRGRVERIERESVHDPPYRVTTPPAHWPLCFICNHRGRELRLTIFAHHSRRVDQV